MPRIKATLSKMLTVPPTFTAPATPTPPATCNAPVVVLVDAVVPKTFNPPEPVMSVVPPMRRLPVEVMRARSEGADPFAVPNKIAPVREACELFNPRIYDDDSSPLFWKTTTEPLPSVALRFVRVSVAPRELVASGLVPEPWPFTFACMVPVPFCSMFKVPLLTGTVNVAPPLVPCPSTNDAPLLPPARVRLVDAAVPTVPPDTVRLPFIERPPVLDRVATADPAWSEKVSPGVALSALAPM